MGRVTGAGVYDSFLMGKSSRLNHRRKIRMVSRRRIPFDPHSDIMTDSSKAPLSETNRRSFLIGASAGLMAAGVWPGRLFAEEAVGENGSFQFLAVNDVHFTDPKKCPQWFEKIFAAMRRSAPKAE